MKRYPLVIIALLSLLLCARVVPKTKKKHSAWPDLAAVNFVNGQSCSIDGGGTGEKAKLNNLKNPFLLPSGTFEKITC